MSATRRWRVAKYIYRNTPQLRLQLIDTKRMVVGWWTSNRAVRMPRSGNAVTGVTHTHMLTKVAPSIVRAWADLGYIEGLHYWLWKFPPKNFRIPKAYHPMLSPSHTAFWWNGSHTQFLSAERGVNNGLSVDSMCFEEARLIPYEKVREIIPTVRGNLHHFGNMSCHGSMLFVSDAPRTGASQWLNQYEKQMDPKMIDAILSAAVRMNALKLEMQSAKSLRAKKMLQGKIAWYEAWLNEARMDQLYFSRASTLDNAHVLGIQAIKNLRSTLLPHDYNLSVLNLDRKSSPTSFYPLLNDEIHGFHSEDAAFVESIAFDAGAEKNCLWKSRAHYDRRKPLDIALDYNNVINSLVVGQGDEREYRLLNSFYVLGSDRLYLADVVRQFTAFYAPHGEKTVNYYYDNTAVATDARGRMSFCDEVVEVLAKEGWTVIRHRIQQASRHEDRFKFWQRMLGEAEPGLPRFRFDLDDCAAWQKSAEDADTKQTETGFKKDKSSETRKNREGDLIVAPQDSTHLSEAADCLIDGKFGRLLMRSAPFIG
jgi:hypothetical protein